MAPYDWIETRTCHILKINYPGYREDEIQVQLVEKRGLLVQAKCKEDQDQEEDKDNEVLRVIESYREMKKDFRRLISVLEDDVMVKEINASMENGVLTVVEPKKHSLSTKDASTIKDSLLEKDSSHNKDSSSKNDSSHNKDSSPRKHSSSKNDSSHNKDSSPRKHSSSKKDSSHNKNSSYKKDSSSKNDSSHNKDSSTRKYSSSKKDALLVTKHSLHIDRLKEWKEYSDYSIFKMDVPGYTRDEMNVILQEGKFLIIKEKRSGKIMNIFALPDDVKDDDIITVLEDGVLTINIPKDASPQPSKRSKVINVPFKMSVYH